MAADVLDTGVRNLVTFGNRQVAQVGAQTRQFVHAEVGYLKAIADAQFAKGCAVTRQVLDSNICKHKRATS